MRMVRVTALAIQVSLRNLMAMLEDSMTSVKTLYWVVLLPKFSYKICMISNLSFQIYFLLIQIISTISLYKGYFNVVIQGRYLIS